MAHSPRSGNGPPPGGPLLSIPGLLCRGAVLTGRASRAPPLPVGERSARSTATGRVRGPVSFLGMKTPSPGGGLRPLADLSPAGRGGAHRSTADAEDSDIACPTYFFGGGPSLGGPSFFGGPPFG